MGACVSKHPSPTYIYYTSENAPSGTTPSTNTNDINANDQHQEEIEREIEFAQKEEEELVEVRDNASSAALVMHARNFYKGSKNEQS